CEYLGDSYHHVQYVSIPDYLSSEPVSVSGPARPVAEDDDVDRVPLDVPGQPRVRHQLELDDLTRRHHVGEHQREVVLQAGEDRGLRLDEVAGQRLIATGRSARTSRSIARATALIVGSLQSTTSAALVIPGTKVPPIV